MNEFQEQLLNRSVTRSIELELNQLASLNLLEVSKNKIFNSNSHSHNFIKKVKLSIQFYLILLRRKISSPLGKL